MPKFPTNEKNIVYLARRMHHGSGEYPADFPRMDRVVLGQKRSIFESAKSFQKLNQADFKVATYKKIASFKRLKQIMKSCLKKSQVDCTANPEKLSQIGWSPKAEPTYTTAPNQPTDFICLPNGDNSAVFQWKKAQTGSKATCFILQRRKMDTACQKFESWQMVDFYYDTVITAENQPAGVQLEYRVIASNRGGQSLPSNTQAVIL